MTGKEKKTKMSVMFEPAKIGNIEVKNRFMRSATQVGLADENGFVGEPSVQLIKTLAQNEVGLIVTGNAHVLRSGQRYANANCIHTDNHIPGFKKMAQSVHEADGKIVMQIGHNGAQSEFAAKSGEDYLAVSITDNLPDFGRKPREMQEDDILHIIDAFGEAARRAREAGFDGVQIHGAHGYLVNQFLSPVANKRKDRWGGSLENRMRFVIEVTRAIKRKAGDTFPVMIKIGCRDYFEDGGGFTIEEGARTVKALEDEGICQVEISFGNMEPKFRQSFLGITSPEKEAVYLPEARTIRKKTTVSIALVTGLRSLPVMEELIQSGEVDFISLCRPLIREPDLIKRWREGDTRAADCISCPDPTKRTAYGCFNMDENGKFSVFCRQLKEQ
jgi:2,4-dienoyl-CoA reductase-like NADH-dependent reductase (Old Yellow Enzyme family)